MILTRNCDFPILVGKCDFHFDRKYDFRFSQEIMIFGFGKKTPFSVFFFFCGKCDFLVLLGNMINVIFHF